jgi:hypothetical protein
LPKAHLLQNLQQEVPSDTIERFGDVQLHEKGRLLGSVKSFNKILGVEEIILNASSFYESAMGSGNQLVQERCQSVSHQL